MGISLLVLWSICLSSTLVHFKNGPEYLTRETAKVFISLTRLLSFVSINFKYFLSSYEFLTPVLVDGLSLEFELY